MKSFVKERHEAFADVLHKQDLTKLRKYSKKYNVPMPKSRKVAFLGVMKAIQYCVDFNEDEKAMAMRWCLDNGFNPFLKPYDWSDYE